MTQQVKPELKTDDQGRYYVETQKEVHGEMITVKIYSQTEDKRKAAETIREVRDENS